MSTYLLFVYPENNMLHELAVKAGVSAGTVVETKPAAWRMPRPRLGLVMWKHHGAVGDECYGIVTQILNGMISVRVFTSSGITGKFGVKHVSDPSLAKMTSPNEGGVWDYCPGEQSINRELDELRVSVAELAETVRRQGEDIEGLVAKASRGSK